MKTIHSIILILTLTSCSKLSTDTHFKRTIDIDQGHVKMTIPLPEKFDTSYIWTNYTDHSCGDLKMYRFANRNYSLQKESGFVYQFNVDSLYQLTVSHLSDKECGNTYFEIDNGSLKEMISIRQKENPKDPYDHIEIEKINGQDFLVIKQTSTLENKTKAILKAKTVSNGNLISIEFHCYSNDCDNFIQTMERILKKIKITTGNKV